MSDIILTDRFGAQIFGGSGYDGAKDSNSRSTLCFPSNSRRELNSFTRREIILKTRALDANLGIYGRIKSKAGQHAVGKGIFPRPITRDRDWNPVAKRLIEEWGSHTGVYSIDDSRDFWEDQRLAAETMVADGGFFEMLVRSETGAPMVQPLDVFEVEQPSFGVDVGDARWEDGIRTNAYMRPVGYAVRELPGPWSSSSIFDPNYREISTRDMIHVFRRKRAKQLRDLPWFFSGINQGIDVLDLRALETGTAKLHSALAVNVKRKAGDAGKNGISGALEKLLGPDGKPARIDESFFRGAAINYLAADEGIELLTSNRPSMNLLAFIEFLYRDISIATGLPYEVVWNMAALGGATARAILEDAQWWFEMIQDKIVMRHSRRIYIWRLAIAQMTGEIPVCRDPDWWACAWQGPAKLTVDMGRTADANIKLIKNGLLSHERYYDERGLDAREEATAQIEFLAWLAKECEERGVPIDWILEKSSAVNVQIGATDPNKNEES